MLNVSKLIGGCQEKSYLDDISISFDNLNMS